MRLTVAVGVRKSDDRGSDRETSPVAKDEGNRTGESRPKCKFVECDRFCGQGQKCGGGHEPNTSVPTRGADSKEACAEIQRRLRPELSEGAGSGAHDHPLVSDLIPALGNPPRNAR